MLERIDYGTESRQVSLSAEETERGINEETDRSYNFLNHKSVTLQSRKNPVMMLQIK